MTTISKLRDLLTRHAALLQKNVEGAHRPIGAAEDAANHVAGPHSEDAHELWALAQLAPGEGVMDGVARVENFMLSKQATEPVGPNGFATWQDAAEAERMLREQAIKQLVEARANCSRLQAACNKYSGDEMLLKNAAPAWHDAPTAPGLWASESSLLLRRFDEHDIEHAMKYPLIGRWFGQIPEVA